MWSDPSWSDPPWSDPPWSDPPWSGPRGAPTGHLQDHVVTLGGREPEGRGRRGRRLLRAVRVCGCGWRGRFAAGLDGGGPGSGVGVHAHTALGRRLLLLAGRVRRGGGGAEGNNCGGGARGEEERRHGPGGSTRRSCKTSPAAKGLGLRREIQWVQINLSINNTKLCDKALKGIGLPHLQVRHPLLLASMLA